MCRDASSALGCAVVARGHFTRKGEGVRAHGLCLQYSADLVSGLSIRRWGSKSLPRLLSPRASTTQSPGAMGASGSSRPGVFDPRLYELP